MRMPDCGSNRNGSRSRQAFRRSRAQLTKAGHMEEQMHEPFAQLLKDIGASLGVEGLTIGEIPLRTLGIRPDFRVDVAGALVGYVELKQPGRPIPTTGTLGKADQDQWQKLQLLPNVLY